MENKAKSCDTALDDKINNLKCAGDAEPKARAVDVHPLNAHEYADSVREWMSQYYSWQQSQLMSYMLPYYNCGYMAGHSQGIRFAYARQTVTPTPTVTRQPAQVPNPTANRKL